MSKQQPNEIESKFGLYIPPAIIHLRNLTWMEKSLLALIVQLDKEQGCFASNAFMSKILGIGERQISEYISRLKSKGLIRAKGFDGRKRILHSSIESKSKADMNKAPLQRGTIDHDWVEEPF